MGEVRKELLTGGMGKELCSAEGFRETFCTGRGVERRALYWEGGLREGLVISHLPFGIG